MGDLIVAMAGTPEGEALSIALALLSALAHALLGAVNKGGHDPYLNRGAINIAYGTMAAPFALFVFPWPTTTVWFAIGAAYVVHIVYEWFQAASYEKGAFTLVYPIARGTGPIATAAIAIVLFDEHLSAAQWGALLLLSASIFGLAFVNLAEIGREVGDETENDAGKATGNNGLARETLRAAIWAALATGVMIAVYTNVDAYGIRLAENPFTFLAWFFVSGAFGFPIIAYFRYRRLTVKPPLAPLAARGVLGALIAFVSFGAVMLATRLHHVGEAAALRETSIIFATAIGAFFFGERVGGAKLALIGAIATAAVGIKLL